MRVRVEVRRRRKRRKRRLTMNEETFKRWMFGRLDHEQRTMERTTEPQHRHRRQARYDDEIEPWIKRQKNKNLFFSSTDTTYQSLFLLSSTSTLQATRALPVTSIPRLLDHTNITFPHKDTIHKDPPIRK